MYNPLIFWLENEFSDHDMEIDENSDGNNVGGSQ